MTAIVLNYFKKYVSSLQIAIHLDLTG